MNIQYDKIFIDMVERNSIETNFECLIEFKNGFDTGRC